MRQCHLVGKGRYFPSLTSQYLTSQYLRVNVWSISSNPFGIVTRAFAQAGSFGFHAKVGKRRGGGRGASRCRVVGGGLSTVTMRSNLIITVPAGQAVIPLVTTPQPILCPLIVPTDIITLIIKAAARNICIVPLLRPGGMAGGEEGICFSTFFAGLLP